MPEVHVTRSMFSTKYRVGSVGDVSTCVLLYVRRWVVDDEFQSDLASIAPLAHTFLRDCPRGVPCPAVALRSVVCGLSGFGSDPASPRPRLGKFDEELMVDSKNRPPLKSRLLAAAAPCVPPPPPPPRPATVRSVAEATALGAGLGSAAGIPFANPSVAFPQTRLAWAFRKLIPAEPVQGIQCPFLEYLPSRPVLSAWRTWLAEDVTEVRHDISTIARVGWSVAGLRDQEGWLRCKHKVAPLLGYCLQKQPHLEQAVQVVYVRF